MRGDSSSELYNRLHCPFLTARPPCPSLALSRPSAHSTPFLLQAPLVLLNGSLTAGTAFGDELGQVLALGLHTHAVIVTTIINPLRHVATAGRVVCLEQKGVMRTQLSPDSVALLVCIGRGQITEG